MTIYRRNGQFWNCKKCGDMGVAFVKDFWQYYRKKAGADPQRVFSGDVHICTPSAAMGMGILRSDCPDIWQGIYRDTNAFAALSTQISIEIKNGTIVAGRFCKNIEMPGYADKLDGGTMVKTGKSSVTLSFLHHGLGYDIGPVTSFEYTLLCARTIPECPVKLIYDGIQVDGLDDGYEPMSLLPSIEPGETNIRNIMREWEREPSPNCSYIGMSPAIDSDSNDDFE